MADDSTDTEIPVVSPDSPTTTDTDPNAGEVGVNYVGSFLVSSVVVGDVVFEKRKTVSLSSDKAKKIEVGS